MTTRLPTLCAVCIHKREGKTCDAFPQSIPDEIAKLGGDHRTPVPGDHGIMFSLRPNDDKALRAYQGWLDYNEVSVGRQQ
jgi:hypothetical protein